MKGNFVCRACGFVNNVEPEYHPEQEKKIEELDAKLAEYDKVTARYKEIAKKCDEANRRWRKISGRKKFIDELVFGTIFRRFVAQTYPELCRLKEKGLVEYIGAYITINHNNLPYSNLEFSAQDWWNYSYTCENCGYVKRYWKKTVKG